MNTRSKLLAAKLDFEHGLHFLVALVFVFSFFLGTNVYKHPSETTNESSPRPSQAVDLRPPALREPNHHNQAHSVQRSVTAHAGPVYTCARAGVKGYVTSGKDGFVMLWDAELQKLKQVTYNTKHLLCRNRALRKACALCPNYDVERSSRCDVVFEVILARTAIVHKLFLLFALSLHGITSKHL